MNEDRRSDRDEQLPPADEATARLIARGSPRQPVPDAARERVHAAVREAWQDATREKRQELEERHNRRNGGATERRPWMLPLALAASVALAGILIARFPAETVSPAVSAATVAVVSGELRGADGELLPAGADLAAGSSLATDSAGRAALRLADGTSLRLDHDTRLTLAANARISLESGAVYVDTAPAGASGRGVAIVTPYATATDLGTQFEVRLSDAAALVRVREGEVAITTGATGDAGRHVAPAGQAARVAADGGIETSELAAHDPSWDWAESLAPPFDASGRSLDQFLAWSARELGLELRYSGDAAAAAARVNLSGSVAGMTPRRALEAVMATTNLSYRIVDGRLEVYRP